MLRKSVVSVILGLGSLAAQVRAQQPAIPILVVDSKKHASQAEKISGEHFEVIIWSHGHPDWFSALHAETACVLVLSNPGNACPAREMWGERLATQGCRLLPLKVARMSRIVEADQIFMTLHSALVEIFPNKKLIWDENYRKAVAKPAVRKQPQGVSWLARSAWFSSLSHNHYRQQFGPSELTLTHQLSLWNLENNSL